MNYYEVNFSYTSPIDNEIVNDVLAGQLGEIGFESFTESENGLNAYIPENKYNEESLRDKISDFPLEDTAIHFSSGLITAKDWNEEWEKNYFKPIGIGNECIIHASFHEITSDYTYDIIIDPKMAFGTGNHETTFLMISEILKTDLKGKSVLDMGCGTAVLAILAGMKGAGPVIAVDIDEWAYNNAVENVRLNHMENIKVLLGGAEQIVNNGKFNVIFANINRNILLEDIKYYVTGMEPDALLFLSGFYHDDIPAIEEECKKNGLSVLSCTEKNRWVALKAQLIPT